MALVDTSAELSVTVAALSDARKVATLGGELDLYNAETLRARLWPLAATPGTVVIADMSGIAFIDSTALGVLSALARQLRAGGGNLVLATDDPRLRRLLELMGLLALMDVESSLAGAVERVVRGQAG
jgi:anti-sigma B factor antagonist